MKKRQLIPEQKTIYTVLGLYCQHPGGLEHTAYRGGDDTILLCPGAELQVVPIGTMTYTNKYPWVYETKKKQR